VKLPDEGRSTKSTLATVETTSLLECSCGQRVRVHFTIREYHIASLHVCGIFIGSMLTRSADMHIDDLFHRPKLLKSNVPDPVAMFPPLTDRNLVVISQIARVIRHFLICPVASCAIGVQTTPGPGTIMSICAANLQDEMTIFLLRLFCALSAKGRISRSGCEVLPVMWPSCP